MRRAPAPSGSPQGRSTANRPRGRTALCARGSGAHRSGSAMPKRTAASATSAPCHAVQRQALCGGRAAPCSIGSPRRELRASPSASASRHTIRCSVSVIRISKAAAAQVAEGGVDDGETQRNPQRRGESDTPTEVKDRGRGAGERRAASGTPTVAIDRGRGAVRGSPSESSETRRHSKPGHDP